MQCPACGQETAEGKFCTNCGAELVNNNSSNAGFDSTASTTSTEPSQPNNHTEQTSNETVEKIKTTGSNFGHFFGALVKNPSEARKANGSDMSSGIITYVIFSLLVALSYHFMISSIPMGFFMEISFFDSFILPLVVFIILFFVIAGLIFAGGKLSVQAVTFPDVIAKYGAYLIPFLLLYAAGLLFSLIGISALAGLLVSISFLGILLIAPTFILMEQPPSGFDRIYILLGLYIIVLLVFGFFIQSFLESIFGTIMDTMMRNF
ncbi:zinc ribbon domain-containing protein [Virgibacillus doumboii]|uniref:zinc ribbon domain-containing protein n=1 Tax=Virgibacillus doumboii TaxID=2697503 RepID=UPI0013DFCFD6|nr:zinc ribbon domain-containing protein [Virgibacillus doumboii]